MLTTISLEFSTYKELFLLPEKSHRLRSHSILIPIVFLLSLLRTRVLKRLQILPSQMRREDFQRRRLRDLSKRPRRTKRLMSRERVKLRLEIIQNNLSTRLSMWSIMIRSKTNCLRRRQSQLVTNALSFINGLSQIQMLLRTNMMPRELS